MSRRVLDAWAVLAWLQNERPAADRVGAMLAEAEEGRTRLLINIVNVGEVYYRVMRARSEEEAEALLRDMRGWPLRIVPAGNRLVLSAARLKGRYRLSYADAFAVATALRERAVLVTGDPEIGALGGGVVDVEWIRK